MHAEVLASLFIRRQYQGLGYGSEAMDLLERVARDKFGARWVTLDTQAHRIDRLDGFAVEDPTRPGHSLGWYRKRGYEEFQVCIPGDLS